MSAQQANRQAMFAPARTPESVIKSLNDALEGVVNDPEVLKNWADTDVRPIRRQIACRRAGSSILHAEIERRGEVIREQ
jgi:tripartite-type tricarboxylate transporter receptor subunit TctC